jgi:hypothetical protein
MAQAFDPYHKWLGIPPEEQPPNHYRLLGITLFESDPDVISNAADQRMLLVKTFQAGKSSDISQKILNEIAAARLCLLNPGSKMEYDAQWKDAHAVPVLHTAELHPQTASLHPPVVVPVAPTRHPGREKHRQRLRIALVAGAAIVCLTVAVFVLSTGQTKDLPETKDEHHLSNGDSTSSSAPPPAVSSAESTVNEVATPTTVADPVVQDDPQDLQKKSRKRPVPSRQPRKPSASAVPSQPAAPPETSPQPAATESPEAAEKRLKTAFTMAQTPADFKAIAQELLNAADQAIDNAKPDAAIRLVTMALSAARKARDDDLARIATIRYLALTDSAPHKPGRPSDLDAGPNASGTP